MPSGKKHTKINRVLWIISLLLFIKYNHLLNNIYLIGVWDTYLLTILKEYNLSMVFYQYLVAVWFALYTLDFYIHTKYLNPDIDTASDATKRLGTSGKIIDWIFPHRGPTHSIIIWIIIFVPLCWFIGSFFVGGFLAGVCHIVCDDIQTHVKRSWMFKRVKRSWAFKIAKRVF